MLHANEKMRIYCLGMSCAQAVFGARPPALHYAVRVADLLFMTAAHESGLIHRRQTVFAGKNTNRGGWSLYQVEWPSIEESLRVMNRKPEISTHVLRWLAAFHSRDLRGAVEAALRAMPDLPEDTPADDLHEVSPWVRLLGLMLEETGDPLGCLFARLHYLRAPGPVPATVIDMAAYAKRYYNTAAGKATAAKYQNAFTRLCPWPPERRT